MFRIPFFLLLKACLFKTSPLSSLRLAHPLQKTGYLCYLEMQASALYKRYDCKKELSEYRAHFQKLEKTSHTLSRQRKKNIQVLLHKVSYVQDNLQTKGTTEIRVHVPWATLLSCLLMQRNKSQGNGIQSIIIAPPPQKKCHMLWLSEETTDRR